MVSDFRSAHVWRFFRAGGFDQVRLDSGADLLALDQLDQKLWVALACPATGIDFDKRALEILDADNDGRIRAAEILEALRWLRGVLKTGDCLVRPGCSVDLSDIDDSSEAGAAFVASAKRILLNLGKGDAQSIALDDTRDSGKIFAAANFNGDGIIPPNCTEDLEVQAVIADIMTCMGALTDRSGADGVDQAKIDAFFQQIEALGAWMDRETEFAGSAQAGAAFEKVRDKIDGFFLRCRLAAYSDGAAQNVNPAPEAFAPLAGLSTNEAMAALESFPPAHIHRGADLPLRHGLNPAWEEAIADFRDLAVRPLYGDLSALTETEWSDLKTRFSDFAAWAAAKPANALAPLSAERVQALRASSAKAQLDALILQDKALEAEAAGIDAVEKLVVLRTHLYKLTRNFVNFAEFYSPHDKAVFQAGTLYLDGRSADLCVSVADVAKHAVLANLARIYLVYCDCRRSGGSEKQTIMAAFTSGDSDQLIVGRNGVFYDRQGRDWDAAIIRIVEHPISLRQAFWSPYKQLSKFISGQVEKMAAAKAKAVEVKLQTQAAGKIVAPAAKPETFDAGKFAGIFAALGLAVGAIATAIASVVTGFFHLTWWQMPLALVGLVLAVSGPSMVIAFMKLRRRSLAPILDACGWAVNSRAAVNIPFGTSLTATAQLPEGAERSPADPFAEKKKPMGETMVLAVLIVAGFAAAWANGMFDRLLH